MKQLLQYFPQLSLRPDNLPELRGLILQLAVTGKLTAEWRKENPNVEPASELLARIRAEKAELVKAKQIKQEKPLPAVDEAEVPFVVPEGWVWCRLGEATFYGAFAKCEANQANQETWVLELEDIEKDTSRLLKRVKFKERSFKSTKNVFAKGDVLYGKLRPYLDKVIVADQSGVCSTEIIPVKTFGVHSSSFIQLVLKSPYFLKYVGQSTHGMRMPRLGTDMAKLALIPLPPLPEQKAIVQTVAALLQALDQLQQRTEARLRLKADYATAALRRLTNAPDASAAWQALAPHFHSFFNEAGSVQALRAAILQLAVQGKLTAHWRKAHPNVEPASELLARIRAEKAELVKAKQIREEKPLPAVDEGEVPFVVPEGWVWCRLGEIVINRDGERKPITKSERVKGPYDYYGASGVIDKVDDYLFDKDLLLIGEDGANLVNRSTPIAFFARGKYWVNNHAHVLDSPSFSILQYLEKYINSINLEDYLTGMAQPKLPQKRMNLILVPLPPLPEQAAIVQTVKALLGLCTELEGAAGRREAVLGDWVGSVVRG